MSDKIFLVLLRNLSFFYHLQISSLYLYFLIPFSVTEYFHSVHGNQAGMKITGKISITSDMR